MGSLLVDRENDRMGGRIDVEADAVFELLGELRVRRQLECADAMRRELVSLEDTLHRTQAHSRRFCRVLDVSQDAIARDKPANKSNANGQAVANDTSEPARQDLVYAARVSLGSAQ